MKKKKLLRVLLMGILLVGTAMPFKAGADTSVIQNGVGGWTKLTSLPSNLSDYYFVFVDKNNDLMLSYGEGINQTSSDAYKTMVYRTSEDPARNPLLLWTLSANDGGYSIKSAVEPTLYIQTENNAAWNCRVHDNGGGGASWYKWNITVNEGVYTIENGKYTGYYIGPWNAAAFSNGQEVAGNKTGDNIGYFYIYSILRSAVDLTGVTTATSSTPFNYTYKITNPNAVKNTNGWTMGEETGRNNGTGTFDGVNGFFEPSNWNANNFDITMSQSVSGLPAGKYRLRAAIQSSAACTVTLKANNNSSEAFQGSGTSKGTILQTGKETTEGNGVAGWKWRTLDFTDATGTINIVFNTKTNQEHNWANVDNVELYLLCPYLSESPSLPSSTTTSVDTWYKVNIPSNGEYTICSTVAATITYTQNGNQFTEEVSSSSSVTISANGEQSIQLTQGTLYLKSNAASTLEVIKNAEPVIANGIYFFKTDGGKFWLRGEPYGSAVQVYDWGMPVKVTTDRAGVSTLQFADASDWKIFSDGTGIYADNASPANGTWNITDSNGKYIFQNTINHHYMKVDGARILSTETESEATAFTKVTPSEHQTALTNYVNAQATTAASGANLSATTPADLASATESMSSYAFIEGTSVTSTAEKYQGGQWDSRTVYSNTVNVPVAGLYKFTIQAFYRMTDNDATYALHTGNADCPPVYVFFGDAKTPIKSVMDENNSTNYGNNCVTYGDYYYPNGQTGAKAAFQDKKYINTVWVYIPMPGEYTYGIQYLGWAGSHAEWTCYTTQSISLTYYYTGNSDFVQNGVHKYIGKYATAPALETTDAAPVVDVTGASYSGSATVNFTNPNGLVFAANSNQVNAQKNLVVGTSCTNLELEEGHPFINPKEFTAAEAKYNMISDELAGGNFATLMVPFAASLPSEGSAYTLDQGVNLMDGNIRGTAVNSIAANSPVLVTKAGTYSGSGTVPVVASGATFENGELVGTYTAMIAVEGSYVLQNHEKGEGVAFYLVGSTTQPKVNPFRAYIKSQGSNARALHVVFDDEAQGITNLNDINDNLNGEVYDLQGRRVAHPTKGLCIVNGRKTVIK